MSGASAGPVQLVDFDRRLALKVGAQAAGVADPVICADGVPSGNVSGEFELNGPGDLVAFAEQIGVGAYEQRGRVYLGCPGGPTEYLPPYPVADGPQAPEYRPPTRHGTEGPVGPSDPLAYGQGLGRSRPSRVVLIPGAAPLQKVLSAFGTTEAVGSDLVLSGDDLDGAIAVGKQLLACPSSGELRLAVVRVNANTTRDDLLGWFADLEWLGTDTPADNQLRLGRRVGVSVGLDRDNGRGQVLLTARLAGSVFRQLSVDDGVQVPIQNATLTQTTGATQQSVTYRTVGVRVTATPLDFRPEWRAVLRVELSDVVGGSSLLPTIAASSFEGDLRGPGPQVLYGRARSSVSRSRGWGLTRLSRSDESVSDSVAVVAHMVPQECPQEAQEPAR